MWPLCVCVNERGLAFKPISLKGVGVAYVPVSLKGVVWPLCLSVLMTEYLNDRGVAPVPVSLKGEGVAFVPSVLMKEV